MWRAKAPAEPYTRSRSSSMSCPALGTYIASSQAIPIEIQRVLRPIGIVCASNDELGQRQMLPVSVRIHHVPQVTAGRAFDHIGFQQPRIDIIVNFLAVSSIRFQLV